MSMSRSLPGMLCFRVAGDLVFEGESGAFCTVDGAVLASDTFNTLGTVCLVCLVLRSLSPRAASSK